MYDAIVVAGGTAQRLGGADKPGLDVGGTSLLERVLDSVRDASRVIVVGPQRDTSYEVIWVREDPPGGGPVAAIAAALPHVQASRTVVLAADLPAIGPAVPALLKAVDGCDVTVLSTASRDNPLAAAWWTDALRAAIAGLPSPDGAAAQSLLAQVRLARLVDTDGWGADCDTWADVAAARDRLS